jgi:hypothetical protein
VKLVVLCYVGYVMWVVSSCRDCRFSLPRAED